MESKIEAIETSLKDEIKVERERITATLTIVEKTNLRVQEASVFTKLLLTTTDKKADQRALELKAMMMQFMSSFSERPTGGGIIGDHNSNNCVTNTISATMSGSTENSGAPTTTATKLAMTCSNSKKNKRSALSSSMTAHGQAHRVSEDSAHKTDDPKIRTTMTTSSPIKK